MLQTEINKFLKHLCLKSRSKNNVSPRKQSRIWTPSKNGSALILLFPGTTGLRLQEAPATRSFLLVSNPISIAFLHHPLSHMETNKNTLLKKKKKKKPVKIADLFFSAFSGMGRGRKKCGAPLPLHDGLPGRVETISLPRFQQAARLPRLIKVSLWLFGSLRMPAFYGYRKCVFIYFEMALTIRHTSQPEPMIYKSSEKHCL